MANTSVFGGFPREGVQFLRDLAANNNKTWFEANKPLYLEAVQAPALALVEALGKALQAEFPTIRYDTRTNGSGSLMRIYRDTRFSADKSPYKTNIAMMFTPGTGKHMETSGFGLQITPEQCELIAGAFAFPKEQLEAYRAAVLDEAKGAALVKAAEQVQAAQNYPISGKELKRVPRGFDENHPRAEWLKYKGLHVFAPAIPLEVAATPDLIGVAMGHFRTMAPIQQWVMEMLQG